MRSIGWVCAAMAASGAAQAQAQAAPPRDDAYELGELVVTARDREETPINGTVLDDEQLRRFDKVTLDQALDLVPGASAGNTGGSRNERLVFVRGFDRFQTTLSVDGIRVFLPADNRIDFGRFLTADLSEIQIAKGYVSVLAGPGAIGGAINLVTRRPSQPFEAELRAGVAFDNDLDAKGDTASGRIGGVAGRFYAQLSGARGETDHWSLPDGFTPTPFEDGGERDRSDASDWRVNLKAGFTPNTDDEYALTYTQQEGEKDAPLHVTDRANTRFWTWPYWNLDSVAFLSRTRVAPNATVRTRVYRNTFENALFAYDNATQTTQTLGRAFRSFYDDGAHGGSVQIDWAVTATDTLRAAAYYRHDEHVEFQQTFAPPLVEPRQVASERTYSLALENTHRFGEAIDLVLGASADRRDLGRAEDFNAGRLVTYPVNEDTTYNGQGTLIWRVSPGSQLSASVSSRTRFPTLFERFSSRFGQAIPNPGVGPERATNYELNGRTRLGRIDLEGALFYSDLQDALIQVIVPLGPPFGNTSQTRNAGDGQSYGVEVGVTAILTDALTLGGNYTYLDRELEDPTNAAFQAVGVPTHKLFAYADWRPLDRLQLTPSIEAASDRWTVTSSSLISPPVYYRTGSYALANLAVNVTLTERIDLQLNARNLLDDAYQLVDGFPEEGRNYRAELRYRY